MRFDDSLATVLAADTGSRHGAEAAWRQLVDLVGRGRVTDIHDALARLRALRPRVAPAARGASGRALAMATPPLPLVALFAEDDLPVAAPVLRTATLSASDWLALLPQLSPPARSVLRHRRDLPPAVVRGLESFGAADFVLAHDRASIESKGDSAAPREPLEDEAPAPAPTERRARANDEPRFEIADLVARIDAFRREQPPMQPIAAAVAPDRFQFHADAAGVIRWVEGVARGPLVGICLRDDRPQGLATLDHGLPDRVAFRALALHVGGDSSAAGDWLLAGTPRFDPATGAFMGHAGHARRLVAQATPAPASDSLRQLVHELRTPANAIGGFAELIATELLGPVSPVYRDRAALIAREAGGLTAAVEDLDTAARLEGGVLDLRSEKVDLVPLLAQAADELTARAQERGVRLTTQTPPWAEAQGDERAIARLLQRLLALAVAAAAPGERIHAQLAVKLRGVRLHVTRPKALPADEDTLLSIRPEDGHDGVLLGPGFVLALCRELAGALGGTLAITPDRLTLRLPGPVTAMMEQAGSR